MIERKKKLRFIQLILLLIGTLIIFFTYVNNQKSNNSEKIPSKFQQRVQKDLENNSEKADVFYNIKYSGLDLSGNRYILQSKEAYKKDSDAEIVNMKFVEATFYFKDDTVLNISSEEGIYNNKTLDMNFSRNVKAIYEDSKLFAENAEYSNSKSFLTITDKVKVIDTRGTVVADKLLFDIKKQTLNIASFNDNKINANINYK